MKRIRFIACVLLLLAGSYSFAQTGVNVTYYNGNVQSFTVDATGKLYFVSDDLYVKLNETATPTTIPVSIIRKITFDTSSVMSVDLTQFKAIANQCAATVNWASGAEQNFSHYELQYGAGSASLEKVAKVEGKGSNSAYSVNLVGLNGEVYYRLKMVDKDGKTKYSSIISNKITCSQSDYTSVYPNPASDIIRIKSGNISNLNIKIFSPTGQMIKQGLYRPGQDISIADLPAGLYLVQINGSTTTKLIKK